MILAKAPLRVSFFGGGTDVPEYYINNGGGATISIAVDKFVYVAVSKTPHRHVKISYMKQELVYDINDIEHDIVREVLKYFGIKTGIEINTWADIPTIGSGLGGSSAFTCALISAVVDLYSFSGYNAYSIAELASKIEIEKCGWRIGKQDQYASAFGGMNYIEYSESGCKISKIDDNNILDNCVLISTGIQRKATSILDTVVFDKSNHLDKIKDIAHLIGNSKVDIIQYGANLSHSWNLKKKTSSEISNNIIDDIIETCYSLGSIGCKVLGAGGGGYVLAMMQTEEDRNKLTQCKFKDTVLTVKMAPEGAKVVYRD